MTTEHDTDPDRDAINGDELHDVSDRERLGRIDERTRITFERVLGIEGEIRGIRAELVLVRGRFVELEASLRSVPDLARRSADESGEHLAQELDNLRRALDQEKRESLSHQLAAERAKTATLEKEKTDAHADAAKRRKDLIWKILEWIAIAALAYGASELRHLLSGH